MTILRVLGLMSADWPKTQTFVAIRTIVASSPGHAHVKTVQFRIQIAGNVPHCREIKACANIYNVRWYQNLGITIASLLISQFF